MAFARFVSFSSFFSQFLKLWTIFTNALIYHIFKRRNGARIALGSDFPVEEVNPFLGMHSAIFRTDLDGNSPHGPGGWWVKFFDYRLHTSLTFFLSNRRYPNESLTLEQTLRGFTIDAAFAGFQENRVGSLEIGKEADFIIIDKDFRKEEDVKDIAKTIVLATVVGGKLMFGKIG